MKLISSLITWSMLTGTAYAGAWGDGNFENDDALDWVADCVKSATPVPVSAAIDGAVRSKYIEAPEGSAAVAAAEVVAAALGSQVRSYRRNFALGFSGSQPSSW